MNKIYRTVYNETTNTWVAVEETAKSHRKSSSGVVDNATAGVSGSLKVRSLTAIAAALAMVSPFMANQAQAADVVCRNNTTQALTQRENQCKNGETDITGTMEQKHWGGGTTNGFNATAWGLGTASGLNATAWGLGTASGLNATAWSLGEANGTNSTAWGSGYAGAAQSADTVNYPISSNNYPVDENGNRPTFTITKTVTGNGANATAWGSGRAIGSNATAMANGKAYGSSSLAVGNGAIAYGPNSIAFGRGKAIGSDSIAFGRATAEGSNSFANGSSSTIAKGSNAVAYGESTIAEGNNAMTWGFGTRTAGNNATAFGKWTVASGERATAFGMQNQALANNSVTAGGFNNVINAGSENSASLGGENAQIQGKDSVTLGGNGSQALSNNSLAAVGGVVSAGAENAIAMGKNSTVYTHADNSFAALGGQVGSTAGEYSQNAVAIGFGAVADYASSGSSGGGTASTPSGNVALGVNTHAEGAGTVAIGGQTGSNGAYAQNSGSIAIGAKAEAVGAALTYSSGTQPAKGTDSEYDRTLNSADWGSNTKPSQMVAIGDSAAAYGDQATAIGANTIAAGTASIAMGGDDLGRSDKPGKTQFANIQTQLSTLNSTLTDNGYTAPSTLTNTLTAGDVAYYDVTLAKGDASVVIGQKAVAEGHLSNAVGALSRSKGNNSIAFGTASQTGTDNSIAMGAVATTGDSATQSTAIGYMAQTGGTVDVSKVDSVANMTYSVNGGDTQNVVDLGSQTGTGENSVAVGEHNKVLGSNSTAVGQGNIVIGNNSGAFGDPNVIIGDNSKVVGNDNVVAANKAFVVGNNVTQTADNSVFLGDSAAYVVKGTTTAGISQYTDSYTIGNATYDNAFAAQGSDTMGVVSVGAVGSERRIQNVAAGLVSADSTDAINGSQLNAAYEDLQWRISAAKTGGDINTAIDSEVVGKYTGSKNGGNVKFIAGDGVKINTSRDATTDGSLNLEFSMNATTVSNTDNGSLKLDDINKGNSPATAASVVNAVNNSYWVATDGTNSANVKPSNQVNWVGANGVKVGLNTTTNTFTAELDNTYLPTVVGDNTTAWVKETTVGNHTNYEVSAVDTIVKNGTGIAVSGGDVDPTTKQRTYTVALDQTTQDDINSKLSTLKTRVSKDAGATHSDAQTLSATQTNADFIQGDNIELTAANNGITIATAKDVKFDSVETTNLTATGETKLGDKFTVANDGTVTYSNSNPTDANEVVNKTYADNLGWDLQVNGVKQGDTITNGKAVNFANGSNTTVEFADNAVKVNVNTTTLTATDGKVNNPTSGGDNLTTAQNVADMINQAYWIAQDGNDTG
ncbi:MAG: hypothetical protein IJ187_06120, partial [Neisseriaceae bacterium]|nr:hypothetical protein [Neisseriaceae bacterium]